MHLFIGGAQKRAKFFIACCAVIGMLSVKPAAASTQITASIAVSATVLTACLIVAAPLAFGNYDPTSTSPTVGTTTVAATCTLSAPYTIALNDGVGTGGLATGGAAGRKMTLTTGTTTLGYNLYQDSGYATVWGSTSGYILSGTGNGLLQTYTVYGRIPALQTASAGLYNDSVTATLTF